MSKSSDIIIVKEILTLGESCYKGKAKEEKEILSDRNDSGEGHSKEEKLNLPRLRYGITFFQLPERSGALELQ